MSSPQTVSTTDPRGGGGVLGQPHCPPARLLPTGLCSSADGGGDVNVPGIPRRPYRPAPGVIRRGLGGVEGGGTPSS